MRVSPPVIAQGGPVARQWWQHFCDQGSAEAMLTKVEAMFTAAGGTPNLVCIDATGPGGDYAAFSSYFQYLDATTRIWQISGTVNNINGMVVSVNEFAGDLVDGETIPRPFIDKGPYPQSGSVLHFNIVDTGGDVQLFWSVS